MKLGVYQHYKGPRYLVLGTAHDANVEDRRVVVYVGLERGAKLDEDEDSMAVRTLEDFNQKLCGCRWEDGACFTPLDENDRCANHGHTNMPPVRRFEYVGRRDVDA